MQMRILLVGLMVGVTGITFSCSNTIENARVDAAPPSDGAFGTGGPTATGAPTSPADFPRDSYIPTPCTGISGATPRTLCVDGLNTTGTEDGTNRRPFRTLTAAVAVLQNGDVIQVARGRYNEALNIVGVAVSLVGGFRGAGSAADYASGAGGDFVGRDWVANETTIDASGLGDTSVVHVGDCKSGAFIDGFTITGGRGLRGNRNVGGGLRIESCDSTIQYNRITGNDVIAGSSTPSDSERGGGLFSDVGTMTARW